MTDPLSRPSDASLWSRLLHWLRRLDAAFNRDELAEMAVRLERLEQAARMTSLDRSAKGPQHPVA